MFDDSLSVGKLLGHESGGSDHSKTSVLEFLGLHETEFLRVFWLESERVETNVSRKVSLTEKTRLVDWDVFGLNPSDGGTLLFGSSNGDGQGQPESDRDLGKVGDGRSRNLGIEEEGGSLNSFSNEETNSGEH